MEAQKNAPSAKQIQRRPSLDSLWLSGTLDRKKTVFEAPNTKKNAPPPTPPADDGNLRKVFQKLDTEIVTDNADPSGSQETATDVAEEGMQRDAVEEDVLGAAEGSVAALLRREVKDSWTSGRMPVIASKPTRGLQNSGASNNSKCTAAKPKPVAGLKEDEGEDVSGTSGVKTTEVCATQDTTPDTTPDTILDVNAKNCTTTNGDNGRVAFRHTNVTSVLDTRRHTLLDKSLSLQVPHSRLRTASTSEGVHKRISIDECVHCTKKVYPMEKISADNEVYHKACFRCKKCDKMLSLGSYAALEGSMFCKPCFKKLFKLNGNYSEGFGKKQHKMKWLSKH